MEGPARSDLRWNPSIKAQERTCGAWLGHGRGQLAPILMSYEGMGRASPGQAKASLLAMREDPRHERA
mgnify:CR=1 FL=1